MEKEKIAGGVHNDEEVDPTDNMTEEEAAKEKLKAGDCDLGKIKFTTSSNAIDGKNGDAKIDINIGQISVGMSKEELMKFANDPFWVRLRMFLFVLFWVVWLAMLVGAVVIILLAPRCPPAPRLKWFQKTVMYQVDVSTFKDGDGDGRGDLKGLISKLDYFKELNVKTLVLNAIYAMVEDNVVNYTDINAHYGTMSDFDDLVAEMHGRDLKLVLDFIPNHSSDQHPWFKASQQNKAPYKDYYVWTKSENQDPPNNWLSVNGGTGWKWDSKRREFYFHTYDEGAPDLNFNNEAVRQEINNALSFWLNKSVDGFKMLSASHLVESSDLKQDEPLATFTGKNNPNYDELNHVYTLNRQENVELFTEWRELLDSFNETDTPKVLMAELSGEKNVSMHYYGNTSRPIVDFPVFTTKLTEINAQSNATELQQCLEFWTDDMPGWPDWLLGNKKMKRLADRVGPELLDGFHMVLLLARGTPITYYGDELGLVDVHPPNITMPWLNDTTLGFTNSSDASIIKPGNYQFANVEVQKENKNSHLNIFRELVALRNQQAINFGVQHYPFVTDKVFSMMRMRKGHPGYLVVMNMSPEPTTINFSGKSPHLSESGRVEIRSQNIKSGPLFEGDHPKIKLDNVPLGPKESVVFSFVPVFED